MKKRNVAFTLLVAFLSWVPSASANSGIDAHLSSYLISPTTPDITETVTDYNTGNIINLSGTFTAPTTGSTDYAGIYAENNITLNGNFSGSASASTIFDGDVFGFVAGNDITITELSGRVNVTTSGTGNAVGLESGYRGYGCSITIGTLSGNITATAEDNGHAYGLYAYQGNGNDDTIVIQHLTGTISATAGQSGEAFGLAAADDITITDFSGKVTAAAGINGIAVGLTSGHGNAAKCFINISTLSGEISATAGQDGTAFGLLADGSGESANRYISVGNLTGTISATAGQNGTAYSLYSGNFYESGSASGNDSITISGNGKLIGSVALNGGDDRFTLKGHADISGVPNLDGGNNDGGNDQLQFDGWIGSLSGVNVTNWETIELKNGSTVNLGASTDSRDPKSIVFNTLSIDATSTLLAAGSSPGFYTLTGPVSNFGTISLVDNHDTGDRLTINGAYTGQNGSIKFDVNTGSAVADQVTINGATTGTTKLDLYELGVPTSPASPILLLTTNPVADPGVFTADEYIYPYGPKLYTFTMTEVAGKYYFTALEFNRYREEAALLQGVTPFVENLGFESLAGFHDRHAYNSLGVGQKESPKFWARAYGSSYAIGQQGDAATTISGFSGGTQVGGDFLAAGTGKASQYHIGAYVGTGWQKADVGGIITSKAGELTQNVYDLGLYASIEHPEFCYLEGVVQSGYHYIDITSPDEAGAIKTNIWGILSSLEGGFTLHAGKSLKLEPQVQLIYQHTNDMQISTVIGDATIESHDGLRTRLGLTGTFANTGASFNPFFELNLIKDFIDDSRVTYAADHTILNSKPETTKVGGAVGIASAKSNKSESVAYYAKAGALYGMDGGKNSYDYTLMAGITKAF
jgi:Autotransporter beta-domain/Autochaperone Domain Type 1